MANPDHPRLILHNFLSLDTCKELEFIHKSCSTIGYRPNVFSTTLSHLIATNSAHLIMPFVPIRERLKERVEDFFGCQYELFVEFTGLISWTRGASIGWHSDDNRPYLRQRDFAAVCYLNNYGEDFKGGLFHFQDWEPTTVSPMAGDVLLYTADSRNIHCVDEINDGERLTLTLWFSRNRSHDEDAKLISSISHSLLPRSDGGLFSYRPLPASISMYWFPPDQASSYESGFDVRYARMLVVGCDLYSSHDKSSSLESGSAELSEILMKPLQLIWGDKLFDEEFDNILHVLQVVQFYSWKASEMSAVEQNANGTRELSKSRREQVIALKREFVKDEQLAETILGYAVCDKQRQQPDGLIFSAAVMAWEDYSCKLHKELLMSLEQWKTYNSIFSVSSVSTDKVM